MKSSNKKNYCQNIKSLYIFRLLFEKLSQIKLFEIVKYNKVLQNKLNIGIKDYKEFKKIEIEIIPGNMEYKYSIFNPINENDIGFYHIFFNDDKTEIKRNYFSKNDNVTKIKLIIDEKIKKLSGLFIGCEYIEKINFIKFNRKDIIDMSYIFCKCKYLKEIKLNNFKTDNAVNLTGLFCDCNELEELNLSNFNTTNVTNMDYMFFGCRSLKELNLSNFNTDKVTHMDWMFALCSSLEKLYFNNLNTKNVIDMTMMFGGCSSLKEIVINNKNDINDEADIKGMFYGCSGDLLIDEIISKFKNIGQSAFEDFPM